MKLLLLILERLAVMMRSWENNRINSSKMATKKTAIHEGVHIGIESNVVQRFAVTLGKRKSGRSHL